MFNKIQTSLWKQALLAHHEKSVPELPYLLAWDRCLFCTSLGNESVPGTSTMAENSRSEVGWWVGTEPYGSTLPRKYAKGTFLLRTNSHVAPTEKHATALRVNEWLSREIGWIIIWTKRWPGFSNKSSNTFSLGLTVTNRADCINKPL